MWKRVKILGNKFGLPIIYSQDNQLICFIIFKSMAQEITAHFPSLQVTLNNDYKSASWSERSKQATVYEGLYLFIRTADGKRPFQSLILGML